MASEQQGITVRKADNFSEWFTEIIQKSELVDIRFGVAGFIVHRPWAFKIIRKIYESLEAEVEMQGHEPYLFPRVVKEADLMKEEEHAGFTPEVFWVAEAGDKKMEERFALPPTGEAQIYPTYSRWFRSYKELPFKGYQSRITVFRNEMTTRPFLRGREFCFFETHNVYAEHKDALDQIELDLEICKKVITEKIGIPFYYFKRPKWDTFLGADNTFVADTLMPDGRRNQLASTHDLGTNFSKAYDIKFRGKDGKQHLAFQTCFGPGVWRIMAALIGFHGDDQGLVLPFDIAPIQVVIIPITFKKKKEASEKVLQICAKLEKDLQKKGIKVKFDNTDESPGAKYNNWEMKGVPIRIEIGPKDIEKDLVMMALRTGGEKKSVKQKDLAKEVTKAAKQIDKVIHKRALDNFKENVRDAKNLKETLKILETKRGFVRVPWCSVDSNGEACESKLKEASQGGRVCGTFYPKPEKVKKGQKCIVCEKVAKHIVYIAKSY
jgi:prolyl-tRNA synthetase